MATEGKLIRFIIKHIEDIDMRALADMAPTTIYIYDLNHLGMAWLKDLEKQFPLKPYYCGRRSNGTVYYSVTGSVQSPCCNAIYFNNVIFRDYQALTGKSVDFKTDMEALGYIISNCQRRQDEAPTTPKVICDYQIDQLKRRNKWTDDTRFLNAMYRATRPGSIYIGETGAFVNELHWDMHQAYANALETKFYPSYFEKPHYTKDAATLDVNLSIRHVHGYVRLKPNGYPFIMASSSKTSQLSSGAQWTNYNERYEIDEWFTSPGYKTLADNYETAELETLEGYWWQSKVTNIGKKYFDNMYQMRSHPNRAIKAFAKLAGEYPAGLFQQMKTKGTKLWLDLEGETIDEKGKPQLYNPMVGAFMTDYQRLELSRMAQMFPRQHVLGWDTDAIHLVGVTPEQLFKKMPQLKEFEGPNMGQWHIDTVFTNSYHFAAKQYYGITPDGEFVGKLAGVPDGDVVGAKHSCGWSLRDIIVTKTEWSMESKNYMQKQLTAEDCIAKEKIYA
jgi:hypothetical protein